MKRAFYGLLAAFVAVTSFVPAGLAKESDFLTPLVRTNLVDRWITNTTEVQMQVNRFVTEYHTNWIAVVHTNVVNLYSTNILTTYVTNRVAQLHTNVVDLFVTNRVVLDKFETNF